MKNTVLLLIISLYMTVTVKSQISYENRVEFELKDGYSNEQIFEFGKSGFIISSVNEKSTDNETEWKFEKYDINLKPVKSQSVLLNNKLSIDETFTNKERMHSLFKDRKGNFALLTIDALNLEVTKVEGYLPSKTFITDMTILGDFAFLNTKIKKSPVIISINWKTGDQKLIPIKIDNISSKKTILTNAQVLEDSNEVFVYVKTIISKKKSNIYIVRLNDKGEKKDISSLTKNTERNITNISASKLKEDKYIFTGTYSTKKTNLSEGLFFCLSEKNEVKFIEFYNFTDLDNFLSYLPEKKQERIEKKKSRKEKKGKELKFNYSIYGHDLIELDDGYLFLGEAYYPTYRTHTYTTTHFVNGTPRTTTHTIRTFDGYQYTHAILSKFNKNGELLWDEIFDMWSTYKPFYPKKFISISEKTPNSLKLIFASRSRITSKSFDFNGAIIHDTQSEIIQTSFEGDKTKKSFSNINYWYDNYFIAFGSQKIKNKVDKKNSKKRRKVYFINKIKFD